MIQKEEVFRIGRLGKPHGVDGEIAFSFTDDVFDRTESPYWVMDIDGILVPFFLESYRFRSDSAALVKFLDMDDAESVKMVADHDVFYPVAYASAEEQMQAELSWQHFCGFEVELSDTHQKLGVIEDVDDSTLNVLFRIGKGDDSLIIPANEDFIDEMDLEHKRLVMHLPEGLLSLDTIETFE